MDQFTIPQFIEHEAKIVGPLTFRQFIYVGVAGAICFVFYFTVPFYFFVLGAIIAMFFGVVLAFGKMEGRSLPTILKNILIFRFSPKIYLWKKKTGPPPKLAIIPEVEQKEIKETPVPAIAGRSRLKNLSTQIETKTK